MIPYQTKKHLFHSASRVCSYWDAKECGAYTRDRVLISNIFVWALRPLISSQELEEYCIQNYGNVKKCRIGKCGYVIFDDPKNASKMLYLHQHQYGNKRFYVTASFSWLQPDANMFAAPMLDNHADGADDAHSTGTNILSLNDDCLLAVFGFLDIADQIRAALACERFQNILIEKNSRKFKTFDFSKLDGLTLWQQKELLRFIGDRVENALVGNSFRKSYLAELKFIAEYCVNLKKIKLLSAQMTAKVIRRFIQNCRNIREIHFEQSKTYDTVIEKLRHFRNLEVLSIDCADHITGKHFNRLLHLRELRLRKCSRLNVDYIIGAIGKMKNLRVLAFEDCFLKDTAVGQIIRSASGLEVLHMSTDGKEIIDFGNIGCLKEFSISEIRDFAISSKIFQNLAHAHSENLQTLRIVGKGIINPQTCQEFIKFENLKKLILNDCILYEYGIKAIGELPKLEELILEECKFFTKENLMEILTGCLKLQCLRLCRTIQISKDILKSIIAVIEEKRKNGFHTDKLRIFESYHGDYDRKNFKEKHVSPELEVISEIFYCYSDDEDSCHSMGSDNDDYDFDENDFDSFMDDTDDDF